MFLRNFLQLVVVYLFRFLGHAVVRNFVTQTGEVHRMAVSQMTTMGKIHTEDLITILDRCEVNSHVCLCTTVWLHIRVIGSEQFLGPIDCRLLHDVRPLATAVVTFARITFRVLIRKY